MLLSDLKAVGWTRHQSVRGSSQVSIGSPSDRASEDSPRYLKRTANIGCIQGDGATAAVSCSWAQGTSKCDKNEDIHGSLTFPPKCVIMETDTSVFSLMLPRDENTKSYRKRRRINRR